ncbi:MAG: YegS/Rv2252/BmrU family lipid kinase [Rikenellaceae bacterium]
MKRAIFLYNNDAGRSKLDERAKEIVSILREGGYDASSEILDFKGDQLANRADELDLVVVAGGDGTVNFIVNQLKQSGSKATLGIIPSGTANDFALALGMNRNPIKAAHQIASGVEDCVDCGYVNGLYFVNIFSFGLFATTSQRTPNKWKRIYGKLAYIFQGIKELEQMHDMELNINTDEDSFKIKSLMTLVLNGRTAGGWRLANGASVTDGMFDCLILESKSFVSSLLAALWFLVGGNPSGIRRLRSRNIQILSTENEPTDADGQRGVDFPLNIECLERELKVIIPNRK